MKPHQGLLVLMLASFAAQATPSRADEKVDFARDIEPILSQHCTRCHGTEKRRGGLKLTSRADALLPADSGAAVLHPGSSAKSELFKRLITDDSDARMPPNGPRLTKNEIAKIQSWIDAGLDWPTKAEAKHWAYQKPTRPELPKVSRKDWVRNPIDAFILARLEKEKWAPSPEADPAKLLRRVHLDLIGLPPSVEEVDAFLADPSDAHFGRIVDRLLASPHYGERWARPWLDLARYADSNGFQRDGFRDVWPYRDWVIDAMNADMPFDRFVLEQVAGDLLPNATLAQKIATGFNRCTPVNCEAGVDREEVRVLAVFDRVSTAATAFLGSTFTCAQCHNHKYDPITQEEFYRVFAFFNNTPVETVEVAGSARELVGPKVLLTASDEQKQAQAELIKTRKSLEVERKKLDAGKQKAEAKKIENELRLLDTKIAKLQPSSLVMEEMPKARNTFVMKRGNFLDPGSKVQPGTPSALHAFADDLPRNRLGLGRWLTSDENPLLARVTVNRWWAELFGRGIVTTLEDFGLMGDRPTHPDLLDWLAVEFRDTGWSMKKMHRLIVTSATYRQDSKVTAVHLKRDPDNKLFARAARMRLEAELIRDNALTISGLLSHKVGGPPVFPPQPAGVWNVTGLVDNTYRTSTGEDRYRRGIYTIWRRSSPYPSFTAFDAPDRAACMVARPRTNTPLQALTLLNDPVHIQLAFSLAQKVLADKAEENDRLTLAFRRVLGRHPRAEEISALRELLHQQADRFDKNPQAARKLVEAGLGSVPAGDHGTLAAWYHVSALLMNLDEAITRN